MLYQLNHADVDEAKIIDALVRSGRPIPKDLVDAPSLFQGLSMFYRAFMQLNSCRSSGMGEGPIPWTAILLWCDENEVEGRQRRMVFNHVRSMDNSYLAHRADKMPK